MTLELKISPAEEAELLKKAAEQGVPVEEMLRYAVLGILQEPVKKRKLDPNSDDPFERRIAALQKFLPKDLGSIPDEALRRENLYADED
jgi:hypothetical protein